MPRSRPRRTVRAPPRRPAGHVGERDRVARYVTAASRGVQGGGDGAPDMGDASGSAAGVEDRGVDALDVFRGQAAQLDGSHARAAHVKQVTAVSGPGARAHHVARPVTQESR